MNTNTNDNHTECIHSDCRVPTCANYKARKARHSQSGVLPLQCTVGGCFKCTATRRNVAAALAANMACPVCGAAMHSPATKKGVTFKKQQAAHNKTQKQREAAQKKAEKEKAAAEKKAAAERKTKTPLPAKKAPAKKAPAKKAPAKKAPAKKTPAKKTPAKKTPAKKAPAKKAPAKKAPGLQLALLPLC